MPTGSGKTVVFGEVIREQARPTLVLVPTTQLVEQTVAELRAQIPGKTVDSKVVWRPDNGSVDVMVTTYMAAAKYMSTPSRSLDPSRYELVILDEAHRSMGTMARRFINEQIAHTRQLGFTATEDYNEKRQLAQYLPDEIHKILVKEAVDLGLISPYRVAYLESGADMSRVKIRGNDYDPKELSKTLDQDARNDLVVQTYIDNFAGEKALFNVNSVEHAERLAEKLNAAGVRAASVHGGLSKGALRALLGAAKSGEIMALSQAKIIGEGYNDPGLSVVFNVTPTASFVRSQQRSGRALRRDPENPEKVALIVECTDGNYTREPALFHDTTVSGWDGIDGFVPVEDVVSHYRADSPHVTPLDRAALIKEATSKAVQTRKENREAKIKIQREAVGYEALRQRRSARREESAPMIGATAVEIGLQASLRDYNETRGLNVESLCERNPVTRHIVVGVDIYAEEINTTDLRNALSTLAGTTLLDDPEVVERYDYIRNFYRNSVKARVAEEKPAKTPTRLSDSLGGLARGEREAWQLHANCLGVDPDLFFPERGASTREAKEVCKGCVVREDCLEYALTNGERFGIWGGMSERERRKVRRHRALARAAAAAASISEE